MKLIYVPFLLLLATGTGLLTAAALKNWQIWFLGYKGEYRAMKPMIFGAVLAAVGFIGMAVVKVMQPH